MIKKDELFDFLEEKVWQYNRPSFIPEDPIAVPHRFSTKQDIEISGFLTATIAWGTRKSIINNALWMMQFMENAPYDFVKNHSKKDLVKLKSFVHRTFNGNDFIQFITRLNHIYEIHSSMEEIFNAHQDISDLQAGISAFKKIFFHGDITGQSTKHISDPERGSAAKRMNMFLRWMVRQDHAGVDFGIWKNLSTKKLSCPLDVHTGRVARKLGLLTRKQNDANAVKELDLSLRSLDDKDPVKYDFALFGLGVYENF